MLSEKGKDSLLTVARESLKSCLGGKGIPVFEALPEEVLSPAGAFVTLRKGGSLRGCIGTFQASDPAFKTVQKMAIAAATRDPRFDRVKGEELPDLEIEISVLGPLKRISRMDEIVVGRHGLSVTRGSRHGVLLPQVPSEYGWDREEFLSHTCLKAGFQAEAWKEGDVVLEIFEAEVFSE